MTMQSQNPAHPSTMARRLRYPLAVACLLATATVVAQSSDAESLMRRYPFDPACPWGRIGNGKGMIVRCLSEEESGALSRRTLPPPASPAAPAVTGSAPTTAAPPPPAPPTAPSGASAVSPEELSVTVGPIVADQGELSVTKLSQPKSRYAKCVSDNGGLRERTAEVHVRFLVRSRGIAEGVSVTKRVNASEAAARCVAEIVDRRRVGPPEAPLVGATVVIRFDRITK
jgi:hypothetical protein